MPRQLATFVALPLSLPCFAAVLPVANPGFEQTSQAVSVFNEFTFGAPDGWEPFEGTPGLIGDGASNPFYLGTLQPPLDGGNPGDHVWFPEGPPEGDRVAILFNRAPSGGTGEYGIQQTLVGTPLEPMRRYTLQVEVGNIASGVAVSGEPFNLGGFPGYRVELLAGDTVIGMDDSSLAGTIGEGQFATSTVSVEVPGGHGGLGLDLGIRLVNLNEVDPSAPAADLEVDFDGVRLEVEPLLPGDFNFDGAVDAADYTTWRDNGAPPGDYDAWLANYGAVIEEASPVSTALSVPEPGAVGLLLTAACTLSWRGRSADRKPLPNHQTGPDGSGASASQSDPATP